MAEGAQQLLKVAKEGIERAKSAWLAKAGKILDSHGLQVSLASIHSFLQGQPLEREDFEQICTILGLNWQEIAEVSPISGNFEPDSSPEEAIEPGIGAIVPLARKRASEKMLEAYCKVQLVTGQWVSSESFEFDVYQVDKIPRDVYLNLPTFLKICDRSQDFERFGLGYRMEKMTGIQAVTNYAKLVVLGNSGVGKTVFLQSLIVACCRGKFQKNYIPIFLEFHKLPDLKKGIAEYIHDILGFDDRVHTEQLLNYGQFFIIFDGIDEVVYQERRDLQYQLRAFTQHYYKNRFIIACRTQITDYTFPTFTYVEISELNQEQIKKSAKVCFQALAKSHSQGKKIVHQFLLDLEVPENKKMLEFSMYPIWLNLICAIFYENKKLPSRFFNLYEQGLKLIFEIEDIEAEDELTLIQQELGVEQKLDLLYYLSVLTFTKKELFFERDRICVYITHYFSDPLSQNKKKEREILLKKSRKILNIIEKHNYIIVERTQKYYAFSNLGLQEYLIGRFLLKHFEPNNLSKELDHFDRLTWNDLFILAVGSMEYVDDFVLQIKWRIDNIIAKDKKLQIFLSWVHQKSIFVQTPYKVSAVRAFYFSQAINPMFDPKLSHPLDFSHAVNRGLKISIHDRSLACNLDRDLDYAFNHQTINELAPDFIIDLILDSLLVTYAHDLDLFLTFTEDRNIEISGDLKHALERFRDQLPDIDRDRIHYQEWWKENGEIWTRNLRLAIIEHRNIGYDWQFGSEQKNILKQYYNSIKLLVECIYRTPKITDETIQEIEDTILLPIAEIDKRGLGN
ncbi:NACHT domain-containing protein [Spirulina sp. 06S082]|uniref:NACHT domain-containing protein n=1 Tax=Spirulina sp. 06S082 TaxID=3110248 RepID=UPI002B204A84|nr:NACHT domain-containing protein [Spirulina sp. 06S082]MEA5471013.1 NACHT domain-containing protein [Spirulina sp. 06S082]